jgi:two-component system chemotaxis response regulator CheB
MPSDVRVIVVDDSAFARLAITRELKTAGGVSVIESARDGLEAIEKIKRLKPDVVTLDVEMPNMDGLAALERIMVECPTPVVMLSSLTGEGTRATMRALELGAVDFFLKHTLANPVGGANDASDLRSKIITASKAKVLPREQGKTPSLPERKEKPGKSIKMLRPARKVVVIGSSTGGPKALYQVVPNIPAEIPAAILIVQHMPPGFTNSLASRLNELSRVFVKEADPGDQLFNGMAFVAKGGYHMVVEKGGVLALNQSPPVCGVRPSVDVTMMSAADTFASSVLGVVLTGMGSDGTQGSGKIKAHGGRIIAQDESTCIVWGMPKSVVESGYADRVLPLPQVADGITEALIEVTQGARHE